MTPTITRNPNGTVTARDEATGIEVTVEPSMIPGVDKKIARTRLARALRQYEWDRAAEAVQRGMK